MRSMTIQQPGETTAARQNCPGASRSGALRAPGLACMIAQMLETCSPDLTLPTRVRRRHRCAGRASKSTDAKCPIRRRSRVTLA